VRVALAQFVMKIIKDAFNALKSIKEPGTILDLPSQWQEGDISWEKKAFA